MALGPFTQAVDPTREDYYDQLDHAVPVEQIIRDAREAFGVRYGDALIDRDVTPNVLRIYVVSASDADRKTLNDLSEGNPQVEIADTSMTWEDLTQAKEAVARVLHGVPGLGISVIPDIEAQGVVVEGDAISQPLRSEISKAAGKVQVLYREIEGGFERRPVSLLPILLPTV